MDQRVLFVGAYNPIEKSMSVHSSSAGSKVQSEVLKSLGELYGSSNLKGIAMQEMKTWPFGAAFFSSKNQGSVAFPFNINISGIKQIIFSWQVVATFVTFRPNIVFQYNPSLLLTFSMWVGRALGMKTVLILQDVNVRPGRIFQRPLSAKSIGERLCLFVSRFTYNLFVPISNEIVDDFKFTKERSIVFQGGISSNGREIINRDEFDFDKPYAVFAGRLEHYNGVGLLVDNWIEQDVQIPLHVFGNGSLAPYIKQSSASSVNVIFHGFQDPESLYEFQQKSPINICLRYGVGIDERYFFPSKYFDIISLKGAVLSNEFYGVDRMNSPGVRFVLDDLTDLKRVVLSILDTYNYDEYCHRKTFFNARFSWGSLIEMVARKLEAGNLD